jgi:hypothetical protein
MGCYMLTVVVRTKAHFFFGGERVCVIDNR